MITLTTVPVTDADGTVRRIHNVEHNVGGQLRPQQVVGIGDPEDPNLVAKVTDGTPVTTAKGVVVRQALPNYDSGLVGVPDAVTAVLGTDVKGRRLHLVNKVDRVVQVTVRDGLGVDFLSGYGLPAHGFLNIPLDGMLFDGGFAWGASEGNAVNGQLVGDV